MESPFPAGRQSVRAEAGGPLRAGSVAPKPILLDGLPRCAGRDDTSPLRDGCRSAGRLVHSSSAATPTSRAPRRARDRTYSIRHCRGPIMDRFEQVVRHGDFRVVASAEKVERQRLNQARWKVVVSLWPLGKDPATSTPELIRLEDSRATDPAEVLSNAVALAERRIDERRQ